MRLGPLSAVLVLTLSWHCDGANILCAIRFPGLSHFVMFERLFKELAARGHNVTVISKFPQKTPVPNYTDISIAENDRSLADNITLSQVKFFHNHLKSLPSFWGHGLDDCHKLYALPQVQRLVNSSDHFDLVITEPFFGDCLVGFTQKFRAPLVNVLSSEALPWLNDRVGNPDHPAYAEQYFLPFTAPLNLWERVVNTVYHVGLRLGNWLLSERLVKDIEREVFGDDIPHTGDIVRNASLVLVNRHWSFNQPQPTVPGFIEVGGLHVEEPKPLPKDVETFLNGSPQGVVYFSLGSMIRSDSFAPEKLQAIVDVFSSLPQRVLWKIDANKTLQLPPNVMALKRAPQNDVLSHPNVRLFITHGGLLGIQEAVNAGVPMLAIPMFMDQFANAAKIAAHGNGLQLYYEDLTHESFRVSLEVLLNDKKYRDRARQLSALFRDRPRHPLEEAVYWVEYVLRHNGAPHLRSAAVDLPLYQYLLLDVAAFLLTSAALAAMLLYLATRRLLAVLRPTVPALAREKTKTS